jgi:hypothetical protein
LTSDTSDQILLLLTHVIHPELTRVTAQQPAVVLQVMTRVAKRSRTRGPFFCHLSKAGAPFPRDLPALLSKMAPGYRGGDVLI